MFVSVHKVKQKTDCKLVSAARGLASESDVSSAHVSHRRLQTLTIHLPVSPLTQLSDDDERMSVGSRGSVRVSITQAAKLFYFPLSAFSFTKTEPVLLSQSVIVIELVSVRLTAMLCVSAQSDLDAVGAYGRGVRADAVDGVKCVFDSQLV